MPSFAVLYCHWGQLKSRVSVQSVNQTTECTVACAAPVPPGALCSARCTSWRALVDKALASTCLHCFRSVKSLWECQISELGVSSPPTSWSNLLFGFLWTMEGLLALWGISILFHTPAGLWTHSCCINDDLNWEIHRSVVFRHRILRAMLLFLVCKLSFWYHLVFFCRYK